MTHKYLKEVGQHFVPENMDADLVSILADIIHAVDPLIRDYNERREVTVGCWACMKYPCLCPVPQPQESAEVIDCKDPNCLCNTPRPALQQPGKEEHDKDFCGKDGCLCFAPDGTAADGPLCKCHKQEEPFVVKGQPEGTEMIESEADIERILAAIGGWKQQEGKHNNPDCLRIHNDKHGDDPVVGQNCFCECHRREEPSCKRCGTALTYSQDGCLYCSPPKVPSAKDEVIALVRKAAAAPYESAAREDLLQQAFRKVEALKTCNHE